uniref:Tetraspanin-6 n=1 Tax=Nelumbo nucifera TaxID=4432 RepID=A0A822Y237_NELNU|nr:TPA_asm: hypothetical protein HUJ06_029422 [Nelumbo nucifera]
MYRFSNTVIGFLNLFTLLGSIPIIGGGLWMARNSTSCESFLQTSLLVIGFVVLVVSLAGFIGACFNVAWALWVYLAVMLLLIATLLSFTIFGFVVTSQGGGVQVPGRVYKEYRLQDYSPWLRNRVKDPRYWRTIRTCLLGSKTCSKLAYWTPLDYLERDLSPIQKLRELMSYDIFGFISLVVASPRLRATMARQPCWRRTRTAIGGTMWPLCSAMSATRARPECWKT